MTTSAAPAPSTLPPAVLERILATAEACHEANRIYCESIGDFSQSAWAGAADWQKESCVAGVAAVFEGAIANPGDAHRAWLEHKVADGWTYGPEKDADRKTHPCLVPFDQLPAEQQRKDVIFVSLARAMLAGLTTPIPAPEPASGPWPSEVLARFVLWLQTRGERSGTFGRHGEDNKGLYTLYERFCRAQGYAPPRTDFDARFRANPDE